MKIHVRVMAAIRSLSGVFSFGTIGDGQALKRVGDEIVGGDLTAAEVGAVPDTHDNDGQVPYYNGGWGNLDVGATGVDSINAETPLAGRTAIAATKTWIKTTSPTVSDDSTAGYTAGDRWVNTVYGLEWTAYSVSAGAADWRLLQLTSFAAPRTTDSTAGLNNSAAQMGTLV